MNDFADRTENDCEDAMPVMSGYRNMKYGGPRRRGHINRTPSVFWMNDEEPSETPTPMVRVRILAEYDLYGDTETDAWETAYLDGAIESHLIKHYQMLLVQTGIFGLRHLSFFVDADVPAGDTQQIKHYASLVLQTLVRESDVRVRFVSQIV